MGLGPLEDSTDDQLHPGNLAGDLLAGNGIVAAANFGDKGVALVQHLLHSGVGGRPCRLLRLLKTLLLLLPRFQGQAALLVMAIGLVTGNEVRPLFVQMALQKEAVVDHFHQLFADEFHVFPHATGQLFQCAVGIAPQNAAIFFEAAHPVQALHAACNQANAADQSDQAQDRGDARNTGHDGQNHGGQKAQKAEAGQQAAAHDLHDSHRRFSIGAAIECRKRFRLLDNHRPLPGTGCPGSAVCRPGSVVHGPGGVVHRPAHRFPAHINGMVYRPGDVLIQCSVILRIDGLVDDLLNIPADHFPVLIVVRHMIHSTK